MSFESLSSHHDIENPYVKHVEAKKNDKLKKSGTLKRRSTSLRKTGKRLKTFL